MQTTVLHFLCAAVVAAAFLTAAPAQQPRAKETKPKAVPVAEPVDDEEASGAEIVVPETGLGGTQDVEIQFTAPMVAEAMVGKAVPAGAIVDIKPALDAEVRWQSTRSATLVLKSAPPPGGQFTLTLRAGLKDAEGNAVRPGAPVLAAGPGFGVRQYTPRWFSTYGENARKPEIMLYFSDAVAAAAVAKSAAFVDKSGRRVAVSARTPLVRELGKMPPVIGTWQQQRAAEPGEDGLVRQGLPPESPAVSVVKVTPAEPLPPGVDWALMLAAGIPNQTNTARSAPYAISYGTIATMQVAEVEALPVLDGPRELHVTFNKDVPALTPADWSRMVTVEPLPAAAQWSVSGRAVTVKGSFEHGAVYTVKVGAGVPALDKTSLAGMVERKVKFAAHAPHLSLPTLDAAQWLGGKGRYELATANLRGAEIKVKRIPVEHAVLALRGYRAYEYDESNDEGSGGFTRIPFPAVPGKTVWEQTLPTTVGLDRSERFALTWDEVSGGKRKPGLYFINVEAKPKEEVAPQQKLGAQTMVQLTDMGLAWKFSGSEALVYVFSHTTGKPLAGVSLTSCDDDGEKREQQNTAADGMARLKMDDKSAWLIAQKGDDLHGVQFHHGMPQLDLWSFDVPYNESAPEKPWRELNLFTERPVYQPGETMFFKAIQRMRSVEGLAMPPDGEAAVLRLFDPQQRVVVEKQVKFSATGSLADALRLPAQTIGWYRLQIAFPKPEAEKKTADAAAEEEAEGEEEGEGEESGRGQSTSFNHQFLVQEYQPNSFRIDFVNADVKREGDTIAVPLRAAYLMGKPLSESKLTWTSRLAMTAFAPERWDGFRFCHARSYYVWDGQTYHSLEEEAWQTPLLTGQATQKLNAKGEALIEAKAPVSFGVPGPRTVSVQSEVTDINQQTISATWTRTEHPSAFYLGVKRNANAVRAGEIVELPLAAVKPDGGRFGEPVDATVLVEHLTWNSVRVQTAGAGTGVRNDLVFAKVSETPVKVMPTAPGQESVYAFKPAAAGTHNLTFSAKDANGAEVRTVISIDVFGADAMTWRQNDGVKIELVADKDRYTPGAKAKIVVKTPLTGTALVTVERHKVLKSFLQELKPGGLVELPVEEAWAPNVFVSVTHVRGGGDDPREHKMPEYRTGFCQLKVDSNRHLLALEVAPSKAEYRPGEQVDIAVTAKDHSGKPLPDTELALWAVDEGILSLMPWEAPDVAATFHYDESLFVHTGLSLVRLVKENPAELEFTNKGFVIGGGGEGAPPGIALRQDFRPTAYWHGALKTGADGSVHATFPAPANLTEFRVVAVGHEGLARFGTAESKFKVNKPLMLEPALPRFANGGDQVTLKAVLHNTTPQPVEAKVELTIDDRCVLLDGPNGKPVNGKSATSTVSLAAQGTRATMFTVKFVSDGQAVFHWKANGGTPELSDAVESKLSVGIAEPLLREVQFLTLTGAENAQNLLAKVRPEVLEGRGDVTVTISNSRVLEGAEAIEQLLHYPYGCAEQTSSSMLPWLTLRDLKKALPSLNKPDGEIAAAIQKGVDRLLAMQTREGGITYWPGGDEPDTLVTAHAGTALVLASRAGAEVPESRLKSLLDWLSASLREDGEQGADEAETTNFVDRAYAAWTLALAGRAEAGYHETLFREREKLPELGRALLALAIAEANGPADMTRTLLNMKSVPNVEGDAWAGSEGTRAVRALAFLKLKDPASEAEMAKLFSARSPRGDWRNTFNNGWALMALSREAAAAPPWKAGQPCVLAFAGKNQEINLPAEPASQSATFPRTAGRTLPALTIASPAGARAYAKIEVTGRAKSGEQPARNAGMSIARTWQRVNADGTLAPADSIRTGDLILVSLNLDLPGPAQFLVIDDPLPATMEGVNPNFSSMAAAGKQVAGASWFYDHSEMRRDRVLFFRDDFAGKGRFNCQYLARCVAEGDVMAPPARIEMMYDPAKFGLSPSQRVQTRASDDDKVATR